MKLIKYKIDKKFLKDGFGFSAYAVSGLNFDILSKRYTELYCTNYSFSFKLIKLTNQIINIRRSKWNISTSEVLENA